MKKFIEISGNQVVSMSDEWYELTSEDNFWLRWRFEAIFKQLKNYLIEKPNILEIGCGNGIFLKQLKSQYQIIADGCDLNSYALEHLVDGVDGSIYLYDIFERNALMTEKYDLIFLLDVLEHITDTQPFLNAVSAHLKPGGILVVNVPAHSYMFSRYDKAIGHKRRYSRKLLKQELESAGFSNLITYFWGMFLYPVVLVRKYYINWIHPKEVVKKGFTPPSGFVNSVFTFFMKLELKLFRRVFIGSSLISIVKKAD